MANTPRNPNRPDGNIYRMVIERVYRRAAQEGLRVLLTGTYGDELYCGTENWLADLITDGRWGDMVQDIKLHVHHSGLRQTLISAYVRRAAIQLLEYLPGGRSFVHSVRKWRETSQTGSLSAWLTPFSRSCLTPAVQVKEQLLGLLTAEDCVTEAFYAGRYGLELRHPYRDRRLVEYVLSLPAYQLYRHGKYKHVLRTAMQGILPESVRARAIPTTLLALLTRGMKQNGTALQTCLHASRISWQKYVHTDWLERHWNVPVTIENDAAWAVIPWLCVSYGTWHSTLLNSGVEYVQ
jgi:asparagine synthetase B (glutamine-hydrolysing)